MLRVAMMLYGIVAMSLAGAAVIIVLAAGASMLAPIIVAAVAGAVLALPVSCFVARKLVT
ncbi:MAG: CTP synthetase [Roseobacter sp.]|jgi:hypothetical protein